MAFGGNPCIQHELLCDGCDVTCGLPDDNSDLDDSGHDNGTWMEGHFWVMG